MRFGIHTSSVEAFRKRPRYRDSVGIRCAASCQKGTRGRIRLRGEMSLARSARNVGDAGDGAEIMAGGSSGGPGLVQIPTNYLASFSHPLIRGNVDF
jgi:hypothetical protein